MLGMSDIVPPDKRTPGVVTIDPVIFPVLDKLYERRLKQLSILADTREEDGAYFHFLTHLVGAQKHLLAQTPLSHDDIEAIQTLLELGPDAEDFESRLSGITCWQVAYANLTKQLEPFLPQQVQTHLTDLSANKAQLAHVATCLLKADYQQVNAGAAVVLWAALSTCWAQAVAVQQKTTITQPVTQAVCCPCCHAPPVASLVLGGAREGLRYLQCSLCEARWHKVRAVCVDCGATGQIDHWTLDDAKSPIQVETCGDCKSYIKAFRLDHDPELEAVADDLGSFSLDKAMEEEGFMRIGINPFSFPA